MKPPVRFFTYAFDKGDLSEPRITQAQFLKLDGCVTYALRTIKEHGIFEIRLTKNCPENLYLEDLHTIKE
jgi:hypothetical protein